MTDRKKPAVAFWATVALVVVLVGYPLSFGPACWLADGGMIPRELICQTYRPLAIFLRNHCPLQVSIAMTDYGAWGSNSEIEIATIILDEWILH
jgi:hypothetical protein